MGQHSSNELVIFFWVGLAVCGLALSCNKITFLLLASVERYRQWCDKAGWPKLDPKTGIYGRKIFHSELLPCNETFTTEV